MARLWLPERGEMFIISNELLEVQPHKQNLEPTDDDVTLTSLGEGEALKLPTHMTLLLLFFVEGTAEG